MKVLHILTSLFLFTEGISPNDNTTLPSGKKATVTSSKFLEAEDKDMQDSSKFLKDEGEDKDEQGVFDSSSHTAGHRLRKRSSDMSENLLMSVAESETEAPISSTVTLPNLYKEEEEGECVYNKAFLADGDSVNLTCATCIWICSVMGIQIIRTFDGTLYEGLGPCSYVLVKTESFSVYLNNQRCPENPDAICIKSVEIYLPSLANLKILSNGKLLSSGEETVLPFHINGHITVLRSSSVFMDVATTLGFNLQYDFLGGRLYVILDPQNKDHTRGLCGTFNDNRNDDFLSSSNVMETMANFFTKSWKMNQYCTERDSGQKELDLDSQLTAEDTCTEALGNSVFADCHAMLDTQSFREYCIRSVYNATSQAALCSVLNDYAYHCAQAGLSLTFHASFPECDFGCVGLQVLTADREFTQSDCREFSDDLLKVQSDVMLVEACICPWGTYYDATQDSCVDGELCPCYSQNQAYKIGEIVQFSNGQKCPCKRTMTCSDDITPESIVPQTCREDEELSDCLKGDGMACEPSCQNMHLTDELCPIPCQSGCVCRYGYFRSINGSCVPVNQCPCFHGDDVYKPGDTISQNCNTCTCTEGKFNCTKKACSSMCNAYGVSQFLQFDNVWKKFSTADCEVILSESQADISPAFRVSAVSRRSRQWAGAFTTKTISIQIGGVKVMLMKSNISVSYDDLSSAENQVNIYSAGFYTVVELPVGLTLYYDQHLDIFLHIQPQLQGHVQGMCGDADGKTHSENIMGMVYYAQQFALGKCSGIVPKPPPPSDKHKRYIEERCSLLKSEVFSPCHHLVSVESYYTACVEETKNCQNSESSISFCTAVAAYGRACCRKGVAIDWRTPDICPSPCEYYNRDSGEGPFRFVTLDQLVLTADYNSRQVGLSKSDSVRELDASFMITQSLFKEPSSSNTLISLESVAHPNYFIVENNDGSLRLDKWQASISFRKQATFFWRKNHWRAGYDALESFTSRQYYVSVGQGNSLIMARFMTGNALAMSFKLIVESFGLPSFSICTWRYKVCENPCSPTCQDPYMAKCTLSINVEGCFPHCFPGMVFDEVTHRCVHYKDCIDITVPGESSTPSTTIPAVTTPKIFSPPSPPVIPVVIPPTKITDHVTTNCSDAQCPMRMLCLKSGSVEVETNMTDPCCTEYHCECLSCPSVPVCGPGSSLQKDYDPETQCCPTYDCVVQPSPSECEDVTCPTSDPCSKTGSIQVEVSGSDPCCPDYNCECPSCPSVPNCDPGFILQKDYDPETQCCTIYTCGKSVTINMKLKCNNEVVCSGVTCTPPEPCQQKDAVAVTEPSLDSCCPHYECVPQPSPSECEDVTCPTSDPCSKTGSIQVEVSGSDPCCHDYDCECPLCPSAPDCTPGFILQKDYDPETQCCAAYTCEWKRDECNPVYQEVQLVEGLCTATVKVAVCDGYCHSTSQHNTLWQLVPRCRCCAATATRSADFEVACLDGTSVQLSMQEAVSCGCETCLEGSEGSG
ncbi:otogelin-like protein [Microcaecilia unicolor]|uniref:Otogelin-like protein n=1 Tax=Microcaecilia unicolor TaxID=1415580 RepID=A0A6P7XC61_9AMPH|nr:otogelin-like protein [Microcaecilia unicolor]